MSDSEELGECPLISQAHTMSIEFLISLNEALKYCPDNTAQDAPAVWATRGVRGVKLETVLVKGKRMTSLEALRRFLATLEAIRKNP